MNTTERKITTDNKPGDYFEGKQLKMAQAIYDRNINEIARLITVEHFDVNGRGLEPKYTYLGYAVLINAVPAAASLLENGADVNAPSIKTGLEAAIKAYESLPQTDKKLLGERDLKRYKKDKDNLTKGVDGFGNPL